MLLTSNLGAPTVSLEVTYAFEDLATRRRRIVEECLLLSRYQSISNTLRLSLALLWPKLKVPAFLRRRIMPNSWTKDRL